MKINRFIPLLLAAVFLFIITPFNEASADEQSSSSSDSDSTVIYRTSFEDNNLDGWSAFGGQSVLSIDNVHSFAGGSSLKVSERKAPWTGPAINITKYVNSGDNITFSARIQSGTEIEATLSLTVMVTDVYGTNEYFNIDTKDSATKVWTWLSGTLVIPEDAVDIIFYAEASVADMDFYIDDVTFTRKGGSKAIVTTQKPPDAPEYYFNFEHSAEGWMPRGDMTIGLSNQFAYTGSSSLYASDRTKTWNGPCTRLGEIIPGKKYTYTAWVMYNGRQYENEHIFQLALQYILNGEEVYKVIGEKNLQKGTWAKLTGTYAVPENATDVYMYIQTEFKEDDMTGPNDLISFYVDNIKVMDTAIISRQEFRKNIIKIIVAVAVLLVTASITVLIILKSRKTKAALRTASLDFMTKAYNRNAFEKRIAELESDPDKAKNLCFTSCDVNFLKYINDNYGHESGDKAIKRCAAVLQRSISKKGRVYRTGGDEFVCISPENPVKKIQIEFMAESNRYEGYPFSLAVGSASFDPGDNNEKPDIQSLLNTADQAMYKDKQRIKAELSKFMGMETDISGNDKDKKQEPEQQDNSPEAEEAPGNTQETSAETPETSAGTQEAAPEAEENTQE